LKLKNQELKAYGLTNSSASHAEASWQLCFFDFALAKIETIFRKNKKKIFEFAYHSRKAGKNLQKSHVRISPGSRVFIGGCADDMKNS
jgi:hypothetical protein